MAAPSQGERASAAARLTGAAETVLFLALSRNPWRGFDIPAPRRNERSA
jgi:hypothetical protein